MAEVPLRYVIVVKDDGSAVVENYSDTVKRESAEAAEAAKRGSSKMAKAFAGVRAATSRVGGAFRGLFRAATSLKGLLITGIGAFLIQKAFRSVVEAANRQEDAIRKLNDSLRTAGQFTEEISQKAQDYASALQQQTRFGDEAILETQALLVTYGVTADKLAEATSATLDFAAATGKGLLFAVETVGRSAQGVIGPLKDYGVVVETKGIPQTEIFTEVLTKMNEQFGGRAQKDVESFSGRIEQAQNAFGDILEELGFSITKSEALSNALGGLASGLAAVAGGAKDTVGTGLGDFLAKIVPTADTLVKVFFRVARAVVNLRIRFEDFKTGIQVVFNSVLAGALTLRIGFSKFAAFVSGVFRGMVKIIAGVMGDLLAAVVAVIREAGNLARTVTGFVTISNSLLVVANKAQLVASELRGMSTSTREADFWTRQLNEATELRSGLLTENEALLAANTARTLELKESLTGLNEVENTILENLRERLSQEQELRDKAAALNQAAAAAAGKGAIETAKKVQKQEKFTLDQRLQALGQFFGLAAQAAALGGAQSFAVTKAFAVGEAVVSGILATQKALASAPFPLNIAIAALVAGLAAANVARIASASPGGGAGAAVGAGIGAGPPAPVTPPPTLPPLAGAEAAPAGGGVNISVSVAGFIGNEAKLASELGSIIREAVGDGVDFGMQVSV